MVNGLTVSDNLHHKVRLHILPKLVVVRIDELVVAGQQATDVISQVIVVEPLDAY